MNIVLPVIYYSQKIWDNIIEPGISNQIINLTMSSVREMPFSFQEDMGRFISKCTDQELLDEVSHFHLELSESEDLTKIYLDFIFGLLNKYCEENKIQISIEDYTFKITLKW